MTYRELFISPPLAFGGFQRTFQEADYTVLGIPFDMTSTYRSGARFAPAAIREASLNIETYSFRASIDAESLKIHDLGNIDIIYDVAEILKRTELVVKDLKNEGKLPVILGGEHTLTLGAIRGIGEGTTVVSFDAHLDLRNEYLGRTVSHTTFMRRICEQVSPKKILEIGVRAVCQEELDYAKKVGVRFLTAYDIKREGFEKTVEKIIGALADCEKIYLSIDMDVLDPAYAPAVQNPEPEGLSASALLDILHGLSYYRLAALDLMEVAPPYDQGTTAIQAAKIIYEVLCYVQRSRKIQRT
ncbi:MAG: agmatinase [Candidatus Bathyarchaeia archaeon]